jgi:hypothetical protein
VFRRSSFATCLFPVKIKGLIMFALEFKNESGKNGAILFSTKSSSDMKEFDALVEKFKKNGTEYNIVQFANI